MLNLALLESEAAILEAAAAARRQTGSASDAEQALKYEAAALALRTLSRVVLPPDPTIFILSAPTP